MMFEELSGLEEELGAIQEQEEICPGVFYLTAKKDGELLSREYYAVTEESIIPPEARSYGQKLLKLWIFPADSVECWMIKYEAAKYRTQKQLPLAEPFRATACFAAHAFPEYFGALPVPFHTPKGYTLRHWCLDNGIYWIETDQCEEILAVCYPVWSTELSDFAVKLGEAYNRAGDIEETMGCLFFSAEASCIPLYELMRKRPAWEGTVIDKPALMNAIWAAVPEYLCTVNWQEQSGQNDLFSSFADFMAKAGIEHAPNISADHLIQIFPDAGSDFLLLRKNHAGSCPCRPCFCLCGSRYHP